MDSLTVQTTPLAGLVLLKSNPAIDERGQFSRVFSDEDCAILPKEKRWRQVNLSRTNKKGTVRGMHFQYPPAAESKLIRCIRGNVFDVAVDIRINSSTFLKWHAVELSEENSLQFFLPEGFAHGFQALSDDVELLYLHTYTWDRQLEGSLHHLDPALDIHWPLQITQVSEKDQNVPMLNESFAGIQL